MLHGHADDGHESKGRYRWTCTACGHRIDQQPDSNTVKASSVARVLLVELAAAHLRECRSARFEDVDGYCPADAALHPFTRPVVRRARKIAFVKIGRNKTLHIDYGAEHTPCGMEVAAPSVAEVNAADFYGGKLPRYRLCKTCVAYRRPGIAEEMAVLEAKYGAGGGQQKC